MGTMSYIADEPILSDVETLDAQTVLARENFGMFRRAIRPNMIWGWWTQEVAWQLHRFYNDMVAGRRPKLARTRQMLGCYRLHCMGRRQAAGQENDLRFVL